jgi:hypothetical protein
MQKTLITALLTGMIAATAYSQANAAVSTQAPATTAAGVANGGVSTGAGSISAAAASVGNASGNSLMNTSPSGSTLLPNTGSGGGGVRRR